MGGRVHASHGETVAVCQSVMFSDANNGESKKSAKVIFSPSQTP